MVQEPHERDLQEFARGDQDAPGLGGAFRRIHQGYLLNLLGLDGRIDLDLVNGVRTRRDEFETAALGGDAVFAVLDERGDAGALEEGASGFLLGVNDAEHGVLVVPAELEQPVNEDLVGDADDLEVAGPLHAEQMVEFVAEHIVVALHGGADVAVLLVPADADVGEGGDALVDLGEWLEADFGPAREEMSVLFEQAFNVPDGILLDVLQILFRLAEFLLERGYLLTVFVDLKRGDPADGDFHEAFDLGVGDHALRQLGDARGLGGQRRRNVRSGLDGAVERLHERKPFVPEFFKSGADGFKHEFPGLAGFDLLVNLFLDKDLRERPAEDPVDAFCGGQLEFPGQVLHEFFGVAAEDIAGAHADGAVVADDHVGAGDAHLAVRVGVEGVDGLLRAVAALEGEFDVDLVVRGVVVERGYLDAGLVDGALDGVHQPGGIGGRMDLLDHDAVFFRGDAGPQDDLAQAVLVLGDVHDAALGEVGVDLERFALQDGDLRLQKFVEVVREDHGAGADGEAVGAHEQQGRDFRGEADRLFVAAVVGIDQRGDVVVEEHFAAEFGKTAFDVSRGGGGSSKDDVAERSLLVDEAFLVREVHEGVADGGVAVRMVFHGGADHVRDLVERAVVHLPVERPQDSALDGLQAVVDVGDRAVLDDIGRILDEVAVHHLPQTLVRGAVDRVGRGVVLALVFRFGRIVHVGIVVFGFGRAGRRVGGGVAVGSGGRHDILFRHVRSDCFGCVPSGSRHYCPCRTAAFRGCPWCFRGRLFRGECRIRGTA